jgi:circadian clock protein KaiC
MATARGEGSTLTTHTGDQPRVSSGIAGLDALIEGGFPTNRSILVTGESGTGKTTLAVQFVAAGVAQGEPGICISVDQKPMHLLRDLRRFGWNLEEAVASGSLTLLDASPYFTASRNKSRSRVPVDARNITTDLSQQVRKTMARRLVIDSITSLVPPDMTRAEAHDYLRSLILALEDNLGCTVLITARTSTGDPQAIAEAAEYLASGILELQLRKSDFGIERLLFIKKMRGTAVDPRECRFRIEPGVGVRLADRPSAPLSST